MRKDRLIESVLNKDSAGNLYRKDILIESGLNKHSARNLHQDVASVELGMNDFHSPAVGKFHRVRGPDIMTDSSSDCRGIWAG